MMSKLLWEPSLQHSRIANITKFIDFINGRYSIGHVSYDQLYNWSIDITWLTSRQYFWILHR